MQTKQVVVDVPRSVSGVPPSPLCEHTTGLLVVGSGATGLMAALSAAEHTSVTLLTAHPLLENNSARAQGGIAAALDVADSPLLHVEDTLVAGAGLSDRAAAEVMAGEAPRLMVELAALGVPFEREPHQNRSGQGAFALGLEGSHSRRRILHVGDMTGLAITSTLVNRVLESPAITILEGYTVVDLVVEYGRCVGVLARDSAGAFHRFTASATLLATGGAGALYALTSNHAGSLGEGIALAYRAGAEVTDMEFIQFHPTVFRTTSGQGFLISEAVRGEGATLLSPAGHRFMPALDPRAELAPRDIVTRGIFDAMQREQTDHVLLDLTHLSAPYLEQRFPTITARCRAEGRDPAMAPVPVSPAAHYLMGGIRTDLQGATSLTGLYAAGECACTGIHGANRLASNSLLECLVMGRRAASAALQERTAAREHRAERGKVIDFPVSSTHEQTQNPSRLMAELSTLMNTWAGPLRSPENLTQALHHLATFPVHSPATDTEALRLANAALVARLIVAGALVREESRGAHYRIDVPYSQDDWQVHMVFRRGQLPYAVATVADMTTEEVELWRLHQTSSTTPYSVRYAKM